MRDKETIIESIGSAFGSNEYPGNDFLQGSHEGCEPFEEVGPFAGKADWKSLRSDFLDAHA